MSIRRRRNRSRSLNGLHHLFQSASGFPPDVANIVFSGAFGPVCGACLGTAASACANVSFHVYGGPDLEPLPPETSLVCFHGAHYGGCHMGHCGFNEQARASRVREINVRNEARRAEWEQQWALRMQAERVRRQQAAIAKRKADETNVGLALEPYWGFKALIWKNGKLHSPAKPATWNPQTLCLHAACHRGSPLPFSLDPPPNPHHPVPGVHCTCGIYAVTDMRDLASYRNGPHRIVALVKGEGRVIPADRGFRASKCTIMATWTQPPRTKFWRKPPRHRGTTAEIGDPAPTLADKLGLRASP